MNKNEFIAFYDSVSTTGSQKTRMLNKILSSNDQRRRAGRKAKAFRHAMIPSTAACLILVLILVIFQPFAGGNVAYALYNRAVDGTVYRLSDRSGLQENIKTSVSYIDSRPGLEFFIDGEDISKIEISCDTEYIYIVDWTKTQEEKWWNSDKYQEFDEERQVSVFHPERLYEKSVTLNFDQGFSEYENIWYRWTAYNLYEWASEDHFSHFLLHPIPDHLTENEKTQVAAGQYKAFADGVGHIQLDGCPEELMEDKITITVTDRQGNSSTSVITVKVSNNELKQTVVTARLSNQGR